MSNDFQVLVVELQSSDGTRHALNGMEVDESPLIFNDDEERVGARFKGDYQSRGIQDSGYVNKYPGSSELDADVKDP